MSCQDPYSEKTPCGFILVSDHLPYQPPLNLHKLDGRLRRGGSIVLSTHRDYWQVNVFPKVRKQHLNVGDFRTYGFPSTGLWITNRMAGHSYSHFYLFHSFKNKGTLIFSHQQTSREVKSHRQAIRKTNWYRGL